MSQWVTHRDPRYFPDPEAFRPERWLDGLAKRLPKYAYYPFGGGPRVCIGNTFALMEAALILATVGQRYRFTLASDAAGRVQPADHAAAEGRHPGGPAAAVRRMKKPPVFPGASAGAEERT